MSQQLPPAEKIVEIVLDALELGEVKAAELHGISRPTVSRYKRHVKGDSECRDLFETAQQIQRTEWASKLGRAKTRILEHLEKLALATTDVAKVNSVYRTLSENYIAETVMTNGTTMKAEGANEGSRKPRTSAESERRALREAVERGGIVVGVAPDTKQ